jgi:hypothetical protein
LAGCAALAANGVVHLAVLCPLVLARVAAILAPLGCGKLLAGVELLLTVGEHEVLAAIAAGDRLISHKREKKESNVQATYLRGLFPSFRSSMVSTTLLKELLRQFYKQRNTVSMNCQGKQKSPWRLSTDS